MKKSPASKKPASLTPLVAEVRQLIHSARRGAASVVNTLQVMTNFEIGRRIVEHEQKGAERAEYGAELLKELASRLTEEFGNGFSPVNLSYMKRFYLCWRERAVIFQTVSEKSVPGELCQQVAGNANIPQARSAKPRFPFTLSWSHYVLLLTIKDPDERNFYEIEAAKENWSLSELKRQKDSALYERLALSRDKGKIKHLATEGQIIERPEDMLKEPYVLEFLGLDEKAG